MLRLRPDLFTVLILGAVALGSVVPVAGVFNHWFGISTSAAVGLLFFLHGARLSRAAVLAGMTHWRLHLLVLAVTFVLFPLLGLLMGLFAPALLGSALYAGILFLCALPSTVQSSIAMTAIARGHVSAAVCAASASNVLGVFLTPVLIGLLLSGDGGGEISLSAIESVALQLLLPFILGQLCYRWLSGPIGRHTQLASLVDRGSILMVVYLAFSNAMLTGLWGMLSWDSIVILAGMDLVLLLVVIGVTVASSRLLGFSRESEIAIVFCGSTKSLASGLPMANVIFASQSIGAIVLPLMVFHQIQLLFCAALARRYADRAAIPENAA